MYWYILVHFLHLCIYQAGSLVKGHTKKKFEIPFSFDTSLHAMFISCRCTCNVGWNDIRKTASAFFCVLVHLYTFILSGGFPDIPQLLFLKYIWIFCSLCPLVFQLTYITLINHLLFGWKAVATVQEELFQQFGNWNLLPHSGSTFRGLKYGEHSLLVCRNLYSDQNHIILSSF